MHSLRSNEMRNSFRVALGFVVFSMAGLGISSCVSPRNGLGTSSGTCFTALPSATQAVGNQGTLVGVRKFKADVLKSKIEHASKMKGFFRRGGFGLPVHGASPESPGSTMGLTRSTVPIGPISPIARSLGPSGAPGGRMVALSTARSARGLKLASKLSQFGKADVCAVAFQGNFSGSKVKGSIDESSGKYALVVLRPNGSGTPVSVVLGRLPFVFRHF